jgi:hypothetical protein
MTNVTKYTFASFAFLIRVIRLCWLNVEALDEKGVLFDEAAPLFHFVAH